ncbi:MAG: hypothetical protein AB7N80_05165 [Bdellovibrionales bacterium]
MPIKRLLLILALSLSAPALWAAPATSTKLPTKKAQRPAPESEDVEDTEDQFFNDEEEEGEPLPEEEAEAEYPQEDPADDIVESNQNPDDEGIEYAEEAEKNERERQKRIEERKKALMKPKPAVDEPMPLIKRQREAMQYSTKQANKYIRHPLAKKGLTKITRDKIYVYKTKPSDQSKASSVRFGMLNPTELQNPDTGVVFTDFYDGNNFALLYDYEWQLFRKFGKFGLKLGTGLGVASGNGQFKNGATLNGAIEPKEKFTFLVAPTTAGAIIRLQFWDNQLLVPYGEGGGAVFGFSELRDDGKKPKFGAAYGGYFAAGVAMNLHFLDPLSLLELDREYSINSVFLTAEYRYYVGTGNFDFTGDLINGGVTFEF